MKHIIVSESLRGAQELVTAARENGATDVVAVVFSAEDAGSIARCGVDRVVVADLSAGARKEAAAVFVADEAKAAGEAALLFSSSRRMVNMAATVSAMLGGAPIVDVKELGASAAKHMMYGGKVVVSERSLSPWTVLVMQSAAYEPALEVADACPVVHVSIEAEQGVRVLELKAKSGDSVDLTAAKTVVCIGRGVNNREGFEKCVALKEALGGEMACTRPVTEMEDAFMPRDSYIGASGLIIKPALYVGVAVSGQTQHTMGMYESGKVVVIDKNENSAFFQQCDYGIVGDYHDIVPAITNALVG